MGGLFPDISIRGHVSFPFVSRKLVWVCPENSIKNPPHPSLSPRLCHNVIARERSDRSNLQLIEKQEIATLPSVARHDKKRIMTQPQGKRGLEGCYEKYFRDNRKILLKAC